MQTVEVALRLLYRPVKEQLPAIFSRLGVDYDQRVLPSLGNEGMPFPCFLNLDLTCGRWLVLKSVVAQYDAGELITQREIVSNKVREALVIRAADFGIHLEDVAITHLAFSHEYTQVRLYPLCQRKVSYPPQQSIEAKQVAQQDAERSKFIVMKAEQEKAAAVIRSEGGESLEIRASIFFSFFFSVE